MEDVEGIILAAGLSSRMENYKMALEFNDKTIIETCIDTIYPRVDKITVVGGHNFNIIRELTKKYEKVELIYNEKYMEGMFSSVKLGINNITSNRFFIIPGDYVLVRNSTYKSLLQTMSQSPIVIPTYNGKKGHPVLFKENNVKSIINDNKFTSLREVIHFLGYSTLEVEDEGILYDIDTKEDYLLVLNKHLLRYGIKI
jgi:molybdenum cofactor cytidylyltransferase